MFLNKCPAVFREVNRTVRKIKLLSVLNYPCVAQAFYKELRMPARKTVQHLFSFRIVLPDAGKKFLPNYFHSVRVRFLILKLFVRDVLLKFSKARKSL